MLSPVKLTLVAIYLKLGRHSPWLNKPPTVSRVWVCMYKGSVGSPPFAIMIVRNGATSASVWCCNVRYLGCTLRTSSGSIGLLEPNFRWMRPSQSMPRASCFRQKQLYERERTLRSVQLETLRYLVKEVRHSALIVCRTTNSLACLRFVTSILLLVYL